MTTHFLIKTNSIGIIPIQQDDPYNNGQWNHPYQQDNPYNNGQWNHPYQQDDSQNDGSYRQAGRK